MFARTERLILRPGWPEDAGALARALDNPEISRHLIGLPPEYDEAAVVGWLASPRDPDLPQLLAFLRTRGAPRLIGGAGISRRDDSRLELGYWIERSHWGLGFATEATRAVMRMARSMGLRSVRAGHFLDNPSSARVLRKIGFRPTGGTENRHSRGRPEEAPIALFEDRGLDREPRTESALEVYKDALPA